MTDVIIAGGGPAGVWLASELRLRDIDVLVLEREEAPTPVVRSLGLNARTVEILDMRGVWQNFEEHVTEFPLTGYVAGIQKPPPADLDTTYPRTYAIHQTITERLLRAHAIALGVDIQYGVGVDGVTQHADGVVVRQSNGINTSAEYLVGCDGGRSTVRRAVGVDFAGEASTSEFLIGEVELTDPWEQILETMTEVRRTVHAFGAIPLEGGFYRVVVPAAEAGDRTKDVTLTDLQSQLRSYAGTDFGVRSPRWLSRFGDATRLAQQYRVGRVLLAGDAAHIHPPFGGQGLNLAIHDAFNLGWKLASVIDGSAPERLLDTYGAERRPVAADVLNTTRAYGEMLSGTPGARAMQNLLADLMDIDDVNRRMYEKVTSVGVRYDFDDPDRQVGRHAADRPLGAGRLYEHFHTGRALLLDGTGRLSANGWRHVDELVDADPLGAQRGALIRPDGHVAWTGDSQESLDLALARWFGRSAERASLSVGQVGEA